jgi:hypothetical protein
MNVVRHKAAGEFLERAGKWLERAEAENNLILAISKYFETNEGRVNVNPYFLTVEDSGVLLGAALMTPPRHLIITSMPDPALIALAGYFFHGSMPVPGVVGPESTSRLFRPIGRISPEARVLASMVDGGITRALRDAVEIFQRTLRPGTCLSNAR